jgi:hypothetical protein
MKANLLINLFVISFFLLSSKSLLNCTHIFKQRSPSNKPLTLEDIAKKNIQLISFENGYRGVFAQEDINVFFNNNY